MLEGLGSWLPKVLTSNAAARHAPAGDTLRLSEARYRATFEHAPVPMLTLDTAGRITGASQSCLAFLGFQKNDMLGHNLADFCPPCSDAWAEIDFANLMATGEMNGIERRFQRCDGAMVDVLISGRLERQDDTRWIVCVLTDVTGRHQAEQALRASEERLHQAQKMEAVGQLTGGVAHDFNNMLQGVSGCLDLMERRIAQGRPEEVGRYIQSAREALASATGLTDRMLSFARRQALQPTPVKPDLLLRSMENLIRRGVGPEVQVELMLHNSFWSTLCDANQLESAVLNLVLNAHDAMPEGGRLIITTEDKILSHADLADQNGVEPGGYAEIAVFDTGLGMTADIIARAFEPFFTTKPKGLGTGLGLSQVYGFVHQSGGFVRIESLPEVGTTVRLYLPRHESNAVVTPDAPREIHEAAGTDGAGKTVLVVEDEERVRSMIVEILRDIGFSVVEAEDGPSGLELAQSLDHFDLLVTDVGLPGFNGRRLADAARKTIPELPVLLITGYAGSPLNDAELAPGMELLRKPFAFDALATRVRTMIEASTDRRS